MQQFAASAIAAVYALTGFLLLAGRNARRSRVWLCLAAGVAAGFFAREATAMAWGWLGPLVARLLGPGEAAVHLAVAAGVGELLKALAPVTVMVLAPTDVPTAVAYGAASGAGFAFMAAQPVLRMALGLAGSPFITPASLVVAVVGWFFPVLAHIATTGILARSGVRGGFGAVFLFVWVVQTLLGWSQQLPIVAGVPLGLMVNLLVSAGLFAVLWGVRSPGTESSGAPSTAAS